MFLCLFGDRLSFSGSNATTCFGEFRSEAAGNQELSIRQTLCLAQGFEPELCRKAYALVAQVKFRMFQA